MPKRSSLKSYRPKGKKGWPSKTRSYPWRVGTSRPAEGLKKMSVGVRPSSAVHRFTRWGPTQTLVNGSTAGSFSITSDIGQKNITLGTAVGDSTGLSNTWMLGGAVEWTLKDLPSVTDFTSLFDHYEIEQVDVEVNCLKNSAQGDTTVVTEMMPTFMYVPDFDDGAVPAAPGDILQYQRAKTFTFRGSGKPLKFSIKPRVSIPVFRSGVTSAYSVGAANTTLDLAYTDVPHYGVKFWMNSLYSDATASAPGQVTIQFRMKYHLKFSDPK